jgi:hypothetical protein
MSPLAKEEIDHEISSHLQGTKKVQHHEIFTHTHSFFISITPFYSYFRRTIDKLMPST